MYCACQLDKCFVKQYIANRIGMLWYNIFR